MLSRRLRSSVSTLLALACMWAALGACLPRASAQPPKPNGSMTQATATLRQGQALLRRNQADQSLPLLESALKQFDNTGDQVGAAAAHDALGDVYIRQGQYELALPHYQAAADAYRTWKETGSANLMFAKLGETYYLAGRTDDAQKAFAQISQQGKNNPNGGRGSGGDGSSNGRDGQNSGGTSGTVTFAAVSAALLPGLTCDALGAPRRPDQPALPGSSGGAKASEPPNMGHAPQGADGIGRMDLRVTDEQGNPVSGVEARLSTQRTNGFLCDCMNHTDVTGRALMNPIHIGPQLKLQLKAKGYPAQEINVQPGAIAEPYRVVLHRVGSATVLPPGATPPAAAAAQAGSNASTQPSSPRACFDLYALFIGYVTAELGLGRIDFERNDLAAAQTHFENILAATDGNAPTASLLAARLYRAVARTSLGDIALKQGHYAAAAKLYEQAARIAATDNRPELAWAAARGIGRSSWLQANEARDPQSALALRNEARAAYRTALDRIETLFAGSLRADDARTSFLARTKDVFDEAAMVSAEMSLTTATQGRSAQGQPTFAHAPDSAGPLSGPALAYAVEAFRIAEEGRARSLLDLLSEAHADITAGVPAELLQRRADNLARQQELADLLTGVGANSGAPDNTVTKLEAELERLSLEAQSLENQIRVASPRYNTLVRTQPLTLAEVQTQVLDNDTVLLEYSLGNESSYLWVVTKNNGLALYRLPARANIEAQVERVRAELVPTGQRRSIVDLTGDSQRGLALGGAPPPQNVQAYADAAYALYRSVVAPAASMSANKRLLVVADGALNYVPFEALVTQPTGADFASLPYLVQTNEIIYAPSASVVAALRQQARGSGAQGPPHLLLVADPIFDANDARVKGGAGDENGAARGAEFRGLALGSAVADVTHTKPAKVRLTRLTGTRMEAQQIAQLARSAGAGADVWLDSEASEDNVERRDLSRYRMLHFATHGLLDAERPQFTGLALAPAGADAADGFLRVGEVFNLRLGSPLVILSACETGLGREKRGEGVIGLTRAFMYAGAPTVGVSLWSVADKSTAELMPDFYQRLLKEPTTSAPAALRAAQQQMIAGGRYSAPFYWAPFIIAGDWK